MFVRVLTCTQYSWKVQVWSVTQLICQQCDTARRGSAVSRHSSSSQRHLVHVQKFQMMDNAVQPSQHRPTIVADLQRSAVSLTLICSFTSDFPQPPIFLSVGNVVASHVWRGGVVVRASDLQLRGRGFESRPLRSACNPGQVVHTHVPLFTKQYKLVPAQAGS